MITPTLWYYRARGRRCKHGRPNGRGGRPLGVLTCCKKCFDELVRDIQRDAQHSDERQEKTSGD